MNTIVTIYLTKPQQNKAKKGLAFQVNNEQLKLQPNSEIVLSLKAIKKLSKSQTSNKGFRFKANDYKMVEHNDAVDLGGSFLLPSGGSFLLPDEKGGSFDLGGKIGFKNKIVRAVEKKAVQKGAQYLNKKGLISDDQEDSINILADNLINSKNQQQSVDVIGGLGIKRPLKMIKGDPQTIAYMRSIRQQKKPVEGGKLNLGKVIKTVAHPILQRNVLMASATGNPGLIGAVIAKNAFDDFTASKFAQNNVPKPALTGMKLVSDDTAFTTGGYLRQPVGSGDQIRLNLARPDMFNKKSRPKQLVEGGSFVLY